jgi:hypothetical protein
VYIYVQHVVLVAVVGKLEARRRMLGQKAVGARGCVFIRHVDMYALVAFVLRVPANGADGAVEVGLEDTSMPQRVSNCSERDAAILLNKGLVPLRRLPARHHGYGFSRIEIVLPVGKVEHQPQVVPRQDARETRAELLRIWRLYVSVGAFVDTQLRLPTLVGEDRVQGRGDVGQQSGRGKALGEDAVAAREDGGTYHAAVGSYEAVEATVHEAKAEDIVGGKMRKALEEKLCR